MGTRANLRNGSTRWQRRIGLAPRVEIEQEPVIVCIFMIEVATKDLQVTLDNSCFLLSSWFIDVFHMVVQQRGQKQFNNIMFHG